MSEDGRAPDGKDEQARALEALIAVAARLSAAERLAPEAAEPALRAVADAAAAALHVAAASIALYDPAADRLVFRAAAGPKGDGVIGLSVAPNEGIAGYAFSTGQPLAIADVASDPRFERGTAERTGYLPRSLLAVPLVDDGGIIGVMEWLDRLDGAAFDLADLEIATRVAGAATATARAIDLDHRAARLLRRALEVIAADAAAPGIDREPAPGPDTPPGLDRDAIDALVDRVAGELAGDDPLWRLADRIAQLRAADPDDVELAVAWLDALLVRTARRSRSRSRSGLRPPG